MRKQILLLPFLAPVAWAFLPTGPLPTPAAAPAAGAAVPLPVRAIAVAPAEAGSIRRSYTGELGARRVSALGFERAGRIVEVLVDEGREVAAGAPLARLDVARLEVQRAETQARLDQARAELDRLREGPRAETIAAARAGVEELERELVLAELMSERRRELAEKNAVAVEDLDRALRTVDVLEAKKRAAQSLLDELLAGSRIEMIRAQEANVRALEAGLRGVEVELEKSELRAPFAGVVAARLLDEGAVVDAGMPALRLVEVGALEARLGLPFELARALTTGRAVTLRTGALALEARVDAVLPELHPATRTATVVLALEAPAGATALLGRTVELELESPDPAAGHWLPTSALVRGRRGLWACYVLVEDDAAGDGEQLVERRELQVLRTTGERVLVRGLLSTGELVVAEGVQRLVPGQSVRAL